MGSSAARLATVAAVALLAGARALGASANATRDAWPKTADPPAAPSPDAAPYVSLGYRELMADLLWVRTIGYVGSEDDQASSTRALVEAIVALDPGFERVYTAGALAMTAIGTGATREDMLAAIRVLEQGMARFPANYKMPLYAGQIYTADLTSDDPAEVERWQLEGARLLERAVRIPGAPKGVGTLAAYLRSKLGQREKAIRDLRELILYTTSAQQRQKLVEKLAELEESDAAAIDYELDVERRRFEARWTTERPELPPAAYTLIGPPLPSTFRLEDLAVDRDLIGSDEPIEPLPPLPD